MLGLVLGHQLQEPAPLVLHPDGIEILIVGAEHQHDLGAVQGSKYVGLILGAELVLQGDPGEEHAIALGGQCVVDILGQHAVYGARPGFVGFLIADENIVGRLLAGDLHNSLADFLNGLGLVPIDLPSRHIGAVHDLFQVLVLHHRLEG